MAAQFFGMVIYAILAETALEYLGLGDITSATWGNMLFSASNSSALLQEAWWWFLPPGLCIAILGAALIFINFGIDEIANPRLRNETGGTKLFLKKMRKARGSSFFLPCSHATIHLHNTHHTLPLHTPT